MAVVKLTSRKSGVDLRDVVAAQGWFTPEQEAARTKAYEDMIVHRFKTKLPLSAIERKEARALIKAREGK
jgi:hypothetical protein